LRIETYFIISDCSTAGSSEVTVFPQQLCKHYNLLTQFLFSLFQLHLAAMSSLKGEIIELSSRLQRVHAEKDILDKQFAKLHVWLLFAVFCFITCAQEMAWL